jgi:hypothetical protein
MEDGHNPAFHAEWFVVVVLHNPGNIHYVVTHPAL